MRAHGLRALVVNGFHSVLYEGQAGLRWFTNLDIEGYLVFPLDEAGFTWFYALFHGTGLLDEGPVSNVRVGEFTDGREIERPFGSMPFEEGMVLIFEPSAATKERWGDDDTLPWMPRKGFSLGCPVVVTADGCRRLVGDWWKPGVIRLPVDA